MSQSVKKGKICDKNLAKLTFFRFFDNPLSKQSYFLKNLTFSGCFELFTKIKMGSGTSFLGFTALRENLENQGKIWKIWQIMENLENSGKFLGKSYSTQGKPREKIYTSIKLVETITCGS